MGAKGVTQSGMAERQQQLNAENVENMSMDNKSQNKR